MVLLKKELRQEKAPRVLGKNTSESDARKKKEDASSEALRGLFGQNETEKGVAGHVLETAKFRLPKVEKVG